MSVRYFVQWSGILKSGELAALGRESGLVVRKARKLPARLFFLSAVLGFGVGAQRSLAGMARLASMLGGEPISRQSFTERAARAGDFMRRTAERLMRRAADLDCGHLPGELGAFADVDAIDSTTITLAAGLAERFPACRTNVRASALKVHAHMSLNDRDVKAVRVTSERVHDRRGGLVGPWARDRLLLFDLGYFDYGLFAGIVRSGGDFVTRLKSTCNGEIVAVRNGCSRKCVGERFNQDVYTRNVADLDVRFGGGGKAVTLRVVGIWNREEAEYHWYVTSLDPDEFDAEWVAGVYRLRWQVELLIKNWKSICRMKDMPSADPGVVECLVYASICASLLATIALKLAALRFGIPWHQTCSVVALRIFGCFHLTLGRAMMNGRRTRLRPVVDDLLTLLAQHARSPNRTNAIQSYASGPE